MNAKIYPFEMIIASLKLISDHAHEPWWNVYNDDSCTDGDFK